MEAIWHKWESSGQTLSGAGPYAHLGVSGCGGGPYAHLGVGGGGGGGGPYAHLSNWSRNITLYPVPGFEPL